MRYHAQAQVRTQSMIRLRFNKFANISVDLFVVFVGVLITLAVNS
jgi:hypothetical protein